MNCDIFAIGKSIFEIRMETKQLLDSLKYSVENKNLHNEIRGSERFAIAVAKDYQEFSGEITAAHIGNTKAWRERKKTAYFIRTTAYAFDYYYAQFSTKKEADEYVSLMKNNVNLHRRFPVVKKIDKDFGLIEAVHFLAERGSNLEHSKEAVKMIILNQKYGL